MDHLHRLFPMAFSEHQTSYLWMVIEYDLPTMPLKYNYFDMNQMYRHTSNISRSLVGNKIVDHSDVIGALPVGAAPTTSSFPT